MFDRQGGARYALATAADAVSPLSSINCDKRILFVEHFVCRCTIWRCVSKQYIPCSSLFCHCCRAEEQCEVTLAGVRRICFLVTICFCHHIHFLRCCANTRPTVVPCLVVSNSVYRVWLTAVLRVLQWFEVYLLSQFVTMFWCLFDNVTKWMHNTLK